MMTVKVDLFDDLDAVAADAAGALDRAAQPRLFDRLSWYRLVWRHCPPPGRLLVARAADGAARTWLFLVRDGATASPLACWYSLRHGPVGDRSLVPPLLSALRRAGLRSLRLGPDDDAVGPAPGWIARAGPGDVAWRVAVDGGFDRYWQARPSRLKATVRRRFSAANLRFELHDRPEPALWSVFKAVYAQSWKPAEGSPAFLRALAEQESAAGTLRLALAWAGDRPVAAQLWLVENGIATIHKLSHVIDYDRFSPGTLLTHATMRAVIERDRPTTIDFGLGDEPYKADWMDHRQTLVRTELDTPLSFTARAAAALVRRLARR